MDEKTTELKDYNYNNYYNSIAPNFSSLNFFKIQLNNKYNTNIDYNCIFIDNLKVILFSEQNHIKCYCTTNAKSEILFEGDEDEIIYQIKYLTNNLNDYVYILSSKHLIEILFQENLQYLSRSIPLDDEFKNFDIKLEELDIFESKEFESSPQFYLTNKNYLEIFTLNNKNSLNLLFKYDISSLYILDLIKIEVFKNNITPLNNSSSDPLAAGNNTYLIINSGQLIVLRLTSNMEILYKYHHQLQSSCIDFSLENLQSTNNAVIYCLWTSNIITIHSLDRGIVPINTLNLTLSNIDNQIFHRIFYLNESTLLFVGDTIICCYDHFQSDFKIKCSKNLDSNIFIKELQLINFNGKEGLFMYSSCGSVYILT